MGGHRGFWKIKLEYLRGYFPYEHNVPSDDTLRRFFRALEPEVFEACFIKWIKSFQLDLEKKVIAAGSKTSPRSFDGENRPMHLVSAFASEFGIVLGQLITEEKSNAITAIKRQLRLPVLYSILMTKLTALGLVVY